MNITKYLNTNILNIKNRLNIENNYDIIFKNFKISNINACLVTVDGLTDSTLLQKILENLETHVTLSDKFTIEEVESKIPYYEIDIKDTFEDIETAILSGVTVLFLDKLNKAICIDCRDYPQKKSQNPSKDRVFKGPRDSFVEPIIFNVALIRRRLRDSDLKIDYLELGKITKTDIAICYLESKVNKNLLNKIKSRLKKAKSNVHTLNRRDIEDIIFPRKWYNPFPFFKLNERPDTAASEIIEGEIVILIDNHPNCLILPTSFFDLLEEANDFYFPSITRTYLKFSRLIILLLTLLGTPTLLLLLNNESIIPSFLSFIKITKEVHVPILVQLLLLEISTDGLRLASLNTPDTLSNTLSILGAVVVGEFAAKSGWFNESILLYMAIVTIASYTQPSFELSFSIKFMRIFMLISTQLAGIYGYIFSLLCCILILLTLKTPQGRNYLYPLIPFNYIEFKKKFFAVKEK